MTIKGLKKYLEKSAPAAFIDVPLNDFSGKRIAIDANLLMYAHMSVARRTVIDRTDITQSEPNAGEISREWLKSILNFTIGWLNYNVTPIFVFDGKHPVEKDDTKDERRAKRLKSKNKIDSLYEQLRGDILDRPFGIVEELRKELKNYVTISSEDFELCKSTLQGIGIPCLQAAGDGEQLCSFLCSEGKVAAVFSKDIDNLVFGCPLVITNFSDIYRYDEHNHRIDMVKCIRLDYILQGLKMDFPTFIDLCIMCGCDYNNHKNIRNYGPSNSYKALIKYQSIDYLPASLDIEIYKHHTCRELFSYVATDQLIIEKIDNSLNIDKNAITKSRVFLEVVGVSGLIDRLVLAYKQLEDSQDGWIGSLNLESIPIYKAPAPIERSPAIVTPSKRTVKKPSLKLNVVQQPLELNIVRPFLELNIVRPS